MTCPICGSEVEEILDIPVDSVGELIRLIGWEDNEERRKYIQEFLLPKI